MKAIFCKDENNILWLFSAHGIKVRKRKSKDDDKQSKNKQPSKFDIPVGQKAQRESEVFATK